MHTGLKYTLLFIFGVVIGIPLGAVALVFFLRSDAGAGVIAQYVVSQPQWPSAAPEQSSTATELAQSFASGSTTIPVPKGAATPAYATALNAAMRDMATLAASSTELDSLLTTINDRSVARNFNGFFDLIVQAKAGVAGQAAQIARLGQDLGALNAANQSTPDAQTKLLTQQLVAQGGTLHDSLVTYNAALSQLLSGAVPTAAQLNDLKAQATTLQTQAAGFLSSLQSLEQHFGIPGH